jgi:hypothetical protein
MPDSRRELQQIIPASHTSALGELFIADEREGAQGGIEKMLGVTGLVRERRRNRAIGERMGRLRFR